MSWQILSTSLVIGQGWQSVKLEKKSFIGRKQNKSLLNHLFLVRRKHRYDSKQLSILSHSHSSFCVRLAWIYDIGVEIVKAVLKHTCLL